MAILTDMATWTWEALMRTETTRKTESLPMRFISSNGYGYVR